MKKFAVFSCLIAAALTVNASWYWPFGSDSDDDEPRLSELMEGATEMIDEAAELAAEGKLKDAVAKYRDALDELGSVEAQYPERAQGTEFASLRNKRAYVNAAIDSLLLSEARNNAKAVAVTDTTELEKRYLIKKGLMPAAAKSAPEVSETAPKSVDKKSVAKPSKEQAKKPLKKTDKKSRMERIVAALEKYPTNRKLRLALIGEHLKAERYTEAKAEIDVLLKENMTDSSALNLKAVCEASKGDFKEAEKTLSLSIQYNPRDYHGYYNMANLKLQNAGNKDLARRYYETGRSVGGPKDPNLEALLK